MSTDLFAIAAAIARRFEEERRFREHEREIEEYAYHDEVCEQERLRADWWQDFRDRNPK